jgi:LDH2 family malate/lactate/ureidoglycolate dehydrogenase
MQADTLLVDAGKLKRACVQVLEKVGVPPDQAEMIARVVVEGDLRGVSSHGALRLPAYVHRVRAGLMSAATELRIVQESPATLLLDAQRGFGQIAGIEAMKRAIERAREHGVGAVAVRNTNHFGIAAYYAMMALPHRMIGLVAANAAPSMAAFGGAAAVLGTNPICVAIPTGLDVDIVLDMASSVVARGKIRLAASKGERIPLGWALDADGRPTQDPDAAMDGTLLPIGGPKGYGLALVVDVLAGVLTGADYGPHISSVHDLSSPTSVGFFAQAVDVTAFGDWPEYQKRIRDLVDEIRNSRCSEGVERIFLPGEIEWLKRREFEKSGIPMPLEVVEGLKKLASEVGAEVELPST